MIFFLKKKKKIIAWAAHDDILKFQIFISIDRLKAFKILITFFTFSWYLTKYFGRRKHSQPAKTINLTKLSVWAATQTINSYTGVQRETLELKTSSNSISNEIRPSVRLPGKWREKKMRKENHILFTMLSLSLSLLPKIQKIKNQIIKKFKPKCIMSYR